MAQTVLYVFGAVFVLVGALGFFNDPVLGIFEVDALHNIVHLVTGLILLGLAYSGMSQAKMGAKVFGVVYALVAALGFVLPGDMLLGLIEVNLADDVLHALVAVVLLYVGFAGGSGAPAMPMGGAQGGSSEGTQPHMGGDQKM